MRSKTFVYTSDTITLDFTILLRLKERNYCSSY
nr:MAG TPA_asm: hypothetical protein [Caudoviricetes sp.]